METFRIFDFLWLFIEINKDVTKTFVLLMCAAFCLLAFDQLVIL